MSLPPERSTHEEFLDLLKNVRIFADVKNNDLSDIASELAQRKYRSGQTVFKKGDEGDAMYIIKEGSVRVHDGNHVLSRLVPGQVFGEFALFDKELRSASITAEEPTVLFELGQENFARVMFNKPDVTMGVLRKVIRRIREMNELEGKLAKSYMKIQKQKNEIEEQNQDILNQKAELEKTNEQLTKLNEEKNRLISVVSHGIRNPLTSSLCVADLLDTDKDELSETQKEYLDLIHNSLRRMNSLINQTLDIDLIELQRDKLKPEAINLQDILERVCESFKYTLQLKKIEIDLKTEPIILKLDRNFIYLIIDNLLSNAIKFSPSNKRIIIDLFVNNNKAIIEISDQGPGISEKALQTLFDNPQLHDRQTDKTGLSIAKKYVEGMGGELFCKSKHGQGTTFMVQFDME
ncbi:MAG: cyclic nucleotide-binding domain-containing protein [Bacteroidales bacterium]|nr:cyclic nucleotide-binding domain-containing protein [Bacteroidales bacterium]MCF8403557.1 cyclic nucleotide-binding domain-containing protein [Bacteroidales bacterium]